MDKGEAKRTKAHRYAGGNERLDALLTNFPGETVWVVEGVNGRTLLSADTEQDALAIYNARPNKWKNS